MKFFYINFFISILFFSTNLLSSIENKIVLKVENQIITNFEIKNKILTLLVLAGEEINQNNINKLKKDVLNTLIDTKIKKIEVSKYKIKKDTVKIESYISSIYTDIPSLKKKLSKNNLNYKLLFEDLAIQFMWQELIYDIYSKRINSIDYTSMNNEMTKYIKNASKVEEFKISEIEIPINNNEELEKKISNIEKEIKGLDFDQIILKYNNQNLNFSSSDLGWISSASLDPQINQIISQVKVGNLTKPIKRQDSIIILKLTDKRFSKKQNIDTAKLKKSFINKKKNEQFNLYSRSHLSKLKNNSLIEYK